MHTCLCIYKLFYLYIYIYIYINIQKWKCTKFIYAWTCMHIAIFLCVYLC